MELLDHMILETPTEEVRAVGSGLMWVACLPSRSRVVSGLGLLPTVTSGLATDGVYMLPLRPWGCPGVGRHL